MKFLATAVVCLFFIPFQSTLAQDAGWKELMRLSPGSKIEIAAQSGIVRGRLVSIDDQGLTVRLTDSRKGVSETIAREDVASVTVKRPSAKKIALFAMLGSGVGALAGGSRCKGATVTTSYGSYCQDPHGYYFDKTGGIIGAGAGVTLGLVGLAFPEQKTLYKRPVIFSGKNSPPANDTAKFRLGALNEASQTDALAPAAASSQRSGPIQ